MLVVAGVAIGLVVLLAVPVRVAFRARGVEPFEGRFTVRWLFGLVRVRIRVPRARKAGAAPSPRPPKEAKEARRARKKARATPGRIVAVLREEAFRARARRLVGRLVRAARASGLRLRMRLGLGDPADTGRLWALVGPLAAAASGWHGAEVRIDPEFLDAVLEFDAQGRVRVVPLQVLAIALGFALSPSSIRAWRTLRARDG